MSNTTSPLPLLLGLLLACGAGSSPKTGTQPTAAADDPNCPSMASSFDSLCADPTLKTAPPEAMTGIKAGLESQRTFITAHCENLATPERVAKMNACLTDVAGAAQTSGADASARRSAAVPKVPEVRADPAFRAASTKVRSLLDDQTLACENAENAKRDNSPNIELWRQKCHDAQDRTSAANAERDAVLTTHGIDPRDAAALGLGL